MTRCPDSAPPLATHAHAPPHGNAPHSLPVRHAQRWRQWTIGAAVSVAAACAAAQGVSAPGRVFPAQAQRASMLITQPPEVLINAVPERFAPGVRIHGVDNLLQMSAGLIGQPYPVALVREGNGLVHEVWILSPQEAALPGAQ